jgi:Sulfotransferase family
VTQSLHRKIFLLGVGCQKGGTSWLHDYLQHSDEADLGFLKEYHVFDALDLPSSKAFSQRVQANARKAQTSPTMDSTKRVNALRRLQFLADPESYFDYFHYLLLRNPQVRLTADITPAYAGLSADRLAYIRDGFSRRGVTVKVVFLMRDPFERIWSAVRMSFRKHRTNNPKATILKKTEEKQLLESYKKTSQEMRTRYDQTIYCIEQAFSPEDIYYAFYEHLFEDKTIFGICDFLEIERIPANFDRLINASPKLAQISEHTKNEVLQHYCGVYEAIAAKFGTEIVCESWPNARRMLAL